jgi:CBS domain-containing protein
VEAQGAQAGTNRIDPEDLNDLDRHVLKEAFRQARRLQNRLALDYRL